MNKNYFDTPLNVYIDKLQENLDALNPILLAHPDAIYRVNLLLRKVQVVSGNEVLLEMPLNA